MSERTEIFGGAAGDWDWTPASTPAADTSTGEWSAKRVGVDACLLADKLIVFRAHSYGDLSKLEELVHRINASLAALRKELQKFRDDEPKKRRDYGNLRDIITQTFEAGGFDANEVIDDLPKLVATLREQLAQAQTALKLTREKAQKIIALDSDESTAGTSPEVVRAWMVNEAEQIIAIQPDDSAIRDGEKG